MYMHIDHMHDHNICSVSNLHMYPTINHIKNNIPMIDHFNDIFCISNFIYFGVSIFGLNNYNKYGICKHFKNQFFDKQIIYLKNCILNIY